MNARHAAVSVLKVVVLVLVLGSLSGTALAQATTLTYGDTADGTLSRPSSTVRYAFEAEAGDTVSISAVPADKRALDLYLYLSDPFSNDVRVQDDLDGPNAAILNFYIPAAGRYTINVQSNVGRGDFTLSLELVNHAKDREVLFKEDFSDNQHDWEEGGDEIVTGRVRDGKYVIRSNCKVQQFTWFAAPGFNDADAVPALELDYVFETDVTIREGSGSVVVGLLFDVQQPSYRAASLLTYDTSGVWNYRLFDSTQGDFVELYNGSGASISLGDGQTHRLGLSATSTEIRFWIDGQFIGTMPRHNGMVGTIGLDAGCGLENSMDTVLAEFDNIRVTQSPATFTRPGDTTA